MSCRFESNCKVHSDLGFGPGFQAALRRHARMAAGAQSTPMSSRAKDPTRIAGPSHAGSVLSATAYVLPISMPTTPLPRHSTQRATLLWRDNLDCDTGSPVGQRMNQAWARGVFGSSELLVLMWKRQPPPLQEPQEQLCKVRQTKAIRYASDPDRAAIYPEGRGGTKRYLPARVLRPAAHVETSQRSMLWRRSRGLLQRPAMPRDGSFFLG